MFKLSLFFIFAMWALSSCTNQRTDAPGALLFSDDFFRATKNRQCHIEQINYVKQKIGANALSLSASQLIDRMFAAGDDFFDGLIRCE